MKYTIKNKTGSVIYLNKLGMPLRGNDISIVSIDNDDSRNEILTLQRMGFLEIKEGVDSDKVIIKSKPEQEIVREAESVTQKDGSDVTIGLGGSTMKTKMVHNYADKNSTGEPYERVKDSLEALEKMEDEERKGQETDSTKGDVDSKQEEKMGNDAVILTEKGAENINMSNSILPGAKENKDRDPFIDRKEKEEVEKILEKQEKSKEPIKRKRGRPKKQKENTKDILPVPPAVPEPFIDTSTVQDTEEDENNDDYSDAFIEK